MTIEEPEPIEYDVTDVNGKVGFVIDDYHLPFSLDSENPGQIAGIKVRYEEVYYKNNHHAAYIFRLENTITGKREAFEILGCPIAALFDPRFATAYNRIVADTAASNQFCRRNNHIFIVSRSLQSKSIGNPIPASEVIQLMVDGGGMYFMFSNKFTALYTMLTEIRGRPLNMDIQISDITDSFCPHCKRLLPHFFKMA